MDDTVKFVESTHQYFDKTGTEYESVTRGLKKLQVPFDRDGISRTMAMKYARENNISIDDAQRKILAEWDQKRDSSIDRGTGIHNALEEFLLTGKITDDYLPVINELRKLVSEAYRYYPEVILYDSLYKRAGQADLVVQRQKGASSVYDFYDYKTNEAKGIQFDSIGRKGDGLKHYNRYFLPPFEYLEDCNYNLYSLQLNFYAYFAVRTYGIKVGRLAIIFIDNNLDVKVIPVLFSPGLIRDILMHFEKLKSLPQPKDNW